MKSRSLFVVLGCLATLPACAARSASSSAAAEPVTAPVTVAEPVLTEEDLEIGFLCPMHQDYTQEEAGQCPHCGMALVRTALFDMRDYRLEFSATPAAPTPGETVTLSFQVFHPGTGEPINTFQLLHDRQYHLFVISQDMEHFEHIHPEQGPDGAWTIDVVLPEAGYYTLLSDFMPTGGSAQFQTRSLVTAGYVGDIVAAGARLEPDTTNTETVDGLKATVTYDPGIIRAGTYGHLTFHLSDAQSGQPINELQTYLGAFGHMLIMSEDMIDYVHAHPVQQISMDVDPNTLRGGPQVIFEGLFPKAGRYRAWTQFRYQDKVYTFSNTFEVHEIGFITGR